MSARSTLTLSVTPQLKAFFAGRLATGSYANACEVVPAALRLMERHERDLKAARHAAAQDAAAGR